MPRSLLITFALLLGSSALRAQDMPLSQILIDGEGWKSSGPPGVRSGYRPHPNTANRRGKLPTALAWSPDGGTLYAGYADSRAVWAFKFGKDEVPINGAPYCPLRLPGDAGEITVTAMTVDKDGRLYAATEIGIQVFDPTGRLCGVMESPTTPIEHLTFDGNLLCAWGVNTKYSRKLKTAGAN